MRNPFRPKPAPPAFGQGKEIPEGRASWPSRIILHWLTQFLQVGFSRPLEKEDLWELPPSKQTASLTELVERTFYARCPPEKRPSFLKESSEFVAASAEEKEDEGGDNKSKPEKPYDESLFKALHSAFFVRWWIAGFIYLIGETLRTTTPLVTKVFLTWLTETFISHQLPAEAREALGVAQPRGVGFGVGIAVVIFAMQEIASLLTNHFFIITMTNGLCVRSALIGNIFRKSLRLSGRARAEHSVGQITTMISTDTARLDEFSAYVHAIWVAPIQIILGIGLLLGNLGYSALVGLGIMVVGMFPQGILAAITYQQRQKGVKFTDSRMRLTTEMLQGIRVLKSYGWEDFYAQQIEKWRKKELSTLRKRAGALSALVALVSFIPVLAAVLSFITYSLTGHDLNVAVIFSSLQYFNVILVPMATLPLTLGAMTGAVVAFGRISRFLVAEELPEPYAIDRTMKHAIEIDGDFTWEVTEAVADDKFDNNGDREKGEQDSKKSKRDKKDSGPVLPISSFDDKKVSEIAIENETEDTTPFVLQGLNLQIERGKFVAIVGRVGSGKSSLLQALIGEMRKTRGEVKLGGTVSYVPQRPWIQNATLRENILFGQPVEEDRLQRVIKACSLEHDLAILPRGEETEIGEKGINLSGGQKARVSLARAAYSDTDIVLLDDPLSAVDAYVGKAILENCLLDGPLAGRTRILVTHALHVLDKMDYIYVVENGTIVEQGTYEDLINNNLAFTALIQEFGNIGDGDKTVGQTVARDSDAAEKRIDNSSSESNSKLMQDEERNTGAVAWETYAKYLRSGGSILWAPFVIMLLIANQGATVATNLFLGFWTSESIAGFSQANYMTVYACLGVASALSSFGVGLSFSLASLIASFNLFRAALSGVLRSPTSFFDTTPMGRILSRLSKDIDVLDTELAVTLYQLAVILFSLFGTAALVFYTFPYLGIIFAPMIVLYYGISVFYRRTSIETKRLDSLMRSWLYAAYTETLTGLPTIRAYRIQESSVASAQHGLDMQNRAYYMTITIQRWLAIRLEVLGNILILGISLFAVGFRNTVNPAKIGVVLTYTLSVIQAFAEMVNQFAQNEQNMNAVERVLVYTELPPEGDQTTANDPPSSWPEKGEIEFSAVDFAYRDGLPLVLNDVTFHVKPGEKLGIVGRTGSGKSSLLQALFRMAKLRSGKISIDEYDISEVGLKVLRSRLALVPQDSTLFLGTLRDNLDPQRLCTDAELISILQRTSLLPRDGEKDSAAEKKFSLDSTVGDEGSNFSVGERQLLSLCRALVKNSRIIVLDEATSNVDVETDSKLQRTIQTEFKSSTLLCIAHRLNTIAYYDRVLVMDRGRVAEFDKVLKLFDRKDSIFRALCDEASLTREDILRIRANADITQLSV